MLTYILGTLAILALTPSFVVAGLLVLHVCQCGLSWFFAKFPGEVEMPQPEETPARPSTRFVVTLPGDSLATGIRRAFILSSEYDEVFLVHEHTPVRVTWDADPYSIESEWNGTRKLQKALSICNGK